MTQLTLEVATFDVFYHLSIVATTAYIQFLHLSSSLLAPPFLAPSFLISSLTTHIYAAFLSAFASSASPYMTCNWFPASTTSQVLPSPLALLTKLFSMLPSFSFA